MVAFLDFVKFVKNLPFGYTQKDISLRLCNSDAVERITAVGAISKKKNFTFVQRVKNALKGGPRRKDLALDILLFFKDYKENGEKRLHGFPMPDKNDPKYARLLDGIYEEYGKKFVSEILDEFGESLDDNVKAKFEEFKSLPAGAKNAEELYLDAFLCFLNSLSVYDEPSVQNINKTQEKYAAFVETVKEDIGIYHERHNRIEKIHFVKDNDKIVCIREIKQIEVFRKPIDLEFDYILARRFVAYHNEDLQELKQEAFKGFTLKINDEPLDDAYEGISHDYIDHKLKDSYMNVTFRFQTPLPSNLDRVEVETYFYNQTPFEVDTMAFTFRLKYPCESLEHSCDFANVYDSKIWSFRVVPLLPFYFPSEPESEFTHSLFKHLKVKTGSGQTFKIENLLPGTGYMRRLVLNEPVSVERLSQEFAGTSFPNFKGTTIKNWIDEINGINEWKPYGPDLM